MTPDIETLKAIIAVLDGPEQDDLKVLLKAGRMLALAAAKRLLAEAEERR